VVHFSKANFPFNAILITNKRDPTKKLEANNINFMPRKWLALY
jgi:hypothetical protein